MSRLTLSGTLRARGRAYVIWTYTNYCGRYAPPRLPIGYRIGLQGIELSGSTTGAPCYSRRLPLDVKVLFACPGAAGPAIDEVTPRRVLLCPAGK